MDLTLSSHIHCKCFLGVTVIFRKNLQYLWGKYVDVSTRKRLSSVCTGNWEIHAKIISN